MPYRYRNAKVVKILKRHQDLAASAPVASCITAYLNAVLDAVEFESRMRELYFIDPQEAQKMAFNVELVYDDFEVGEEEEELSENEERLAQAAEALGVARQEHDTSRLRKWLRRVLVLARQVALWENRATPAQQEQAEQLMEEAEKLWPSETY
jgi:hypothetical protein